MTKADALSIPAGSVRCVWVLAVDLPEEAIKVFAEESEADRSGISWPLQDALGAGLLDRTYVEVFKVDTLDDYGLARYLTEANGMDEAGVAPDAARLDAIEGHVVMVFSDALGDGVVRLAPRPPLRLIGRYAESLDFAVRTAPASDAARKSAEAPEPEPRTGPSNAAMGGRVAMVALLVLFALVGLMIWVAE